MGFHSYLLVIWSVITTWTVINASENIALGKATTQSSNYSSTWDSSKAVDGCPNIDVYSGCCTHTALGQKEAWWQVDLQTQSVIETVLIINRDQNTLDKLAGYEIYLSNTSDWTSGTRCHKDTTADLASMAAKQNVTCPGIARYLTIYNDRRVKDKPWYSDDAYTELCEVYVYGCPVGKYGSGNCNNDCLNCLGNICDPTSGTCDACSAGYYKAGGFCIPCPSNCLERKCDSLSAACLECNDGYFGPTCMPCPSGCSTDTCDKTSGHCVRCDAGFYDSFCNMSCPVNCQNNVCHKDNGQCIDCDAGFYGSACRQTCPVNCKDNVCTMDKGHCIDCVDGLHGSWCIQPCPAHCKQNVCTKDNGHCLECDIGFFGNFCNLSCPVNCENNVCHKGNGQCIDCDIGFYSNFCNLSCPVNCENNVCNKDNGQCTECEAGFHGGQCLKSCGNCQGVICDKETGECTTGCTDGWTGGTCDTKVIVVKSTVMNNDAAIGIGVGLGTVILALVIVIIVLIKRQTMKRDDTTNSTHMTDISSSRTAKELNKDQDDNYAEIVTHGDQSIAQDSHTDGNYEKLGRRDVTIPHVYETTNR